MPSRSFFASTAALVVTTAFGCSYPVSDFTINDGGSVADTSTGGDSSGSDTNGSDTNGGTDTNPVVFDTTPSADGSCTPPTQNCSGVCVDINSDHDHCGACDRKCDTTQKCVGGKCRGG